MVVPASPEAVYSAFSDADSLMAWLPPGSMNGRALEYDFREGGRYRIELTYSQSGTPSLGKTSEDKDISSGRFVSLEPGNRIVQTVEFESEQAKFRGQMNMTWSFDAVESGTEVTITAENVPAGINERDHREGLHSSLKNLAKYLGAGGMSREGA